MKRKPIIFALGILLASCWNGSADAQDKPSSPKVDLKRLFDGEDPVTIADLRAMEKHQTALAKKATACTVGVVVREMAPNGQGGREAHGSGVIISKDGYVLTAAHVGGQVDRRVTFIFPDGSRARGKTLGMHRSLDAGLMKITSTPRSNEG